MNAFLWAWDVAECWSVCLGSVRTLILFSDGTNEWSNALFWDQHKICVITKYWVQSESRLENDVLWDYISRELTETCLRVRPTPGSLEGAWKLPGSSNSFPSCPVDYSGKTYEIKAGSILLQRTESLLKDTVLAVGPYLYNLSPILWSSNNCPKEGERQNMTNVYL